MIAAEPAAVALRNLPRTIHSVAGSGNNAAAARKFEAMAIAQLLKPIFATMGKADPPFGGGAVTREFQPFMIRAIATSMEARGGLGLAPMIEQALSARTPAPTDGSIDKGGTGR
ncbi:MAG TPA: rod-binding protein [Acidiphilium sp.]